MLQCHRCQTIPAPPGRAVRLRPGQISQVTTSGTNYPQPYTDTIFYRSDGAPAELIRQQNGTTTPYWYSTDAQHNIVLVSDVSKNAQDYYRYDAWGQVDPSISYENVPQRLRYGGYWYDEELGWYWLNARVYDPVLERFLQPDPSQQDGILSYVYVGNDPLDQIDPTGTDAFDVNDPQYWQIPDLPEQGPSIPWLPSYAIQAQADSLRDDTNASAGSIYQLTPENTYRVLSAGPPGTTRVEVAGSGVEEADVSFYDGNAMLSRIEVKALQSLGKFQDYISEAAEQLDYEGEIWIQIPVGNSLADERDVIWRRFVGFRKSPGRNIFKYAHVRLTVIDMQGRYVFRNVNIGPEFIGPLSSEMTK